MRSPQLSLLVVTIILLTCLTAAWPSPPSFHEIEGMVWRRQDKGKSSTDTASSAAPKTDSTKASATDASSKDDKSKASAKASASASASASGSAAATTGDSKSSAKNTAKSGAKTTNKSSTKETKAGKTTSASAAASSSINPVLPAGGVSMITPAALAQPSYYKIKDYVTFAWNYTSLSVPPSYIDVYASCSTNSALYPITTNATFDKTPTVLWDTAPDATGNTPLIVGTYTLIIYDAQSDITAAPKAGYLGVADQFTFGMYTAQPYTPLANEFVCVTCNSALSDMERQTLKFLFGMGMITVLSFTWFAGGFGALF